MKKSLYENIVDDIERFRGLSRDCAELLLKKYPSILPTTIHGILSSEIQSRLKRSWHKLHGTKNDYWGMYKQISQTDKQPGVIVRMAQHKNLPPALIARIVLEKHTYEKDSEASRADILKLLKNSTLIENCDLAYELYLCSLYDDRHGLISDAFSTSVGYEYEIKLQFLLEERNIAYQTEDKLRLRGYDKTPDVKLEIPIAIDGFIVNWIESKARFGTPEIHKAHVQEQFLSYWNRFGPGLVIYWFGYVDEIVQPNEKKFLVLDHFPTRMTCMAGLPSRPDSHQISIEDI